MKMKIFIISIMAIILHECGSSKLDEKKEFKVNSVQDYSIEELSDVLRNLSLWNYINNSGLRDEHKIRDVMHGHTGNYAFLLAVYGYEVLKSNFDSTIVNTYIRKSCIKLKNAYNLANLSSHTRNHLLKLYGFIENNNVENILKSLHDLIVLRIYNSLVTEDIILLGLPAKQQENYTLDPEKYRDICSKVIKEKYKDFPEPHKGDNRYNFGDIPMDGKIVEEKLKKITELIDVEYKSFSDEMEFFDTCEY